MKIQIPYGDRTLKIDLPESRIAGILKNRRFSGKNVKALVTKSLEGAKLKDLIAGKKKILIVVPDATRSAHLKEILAVLLNRIAAKSRKIDIIIATGLHKTHTIGELASLLGKSILKRCAVLQHDPSEESVIHLGMTEYAVPITLDKNLFNYDFLISVGVIEPHLYAGYSGGAKTIAIGLAGEETINATHGIRFLDDPAVNIGSLKDNPFQETLKEISERIPPVFSINTVNDPDGKAVKIFSGAVKDVFRAGAEFAQKVFEVRAKKRADIAICGIGYPKDINLYQASRAINYILNVDKPVIRKGGVVIIAAELRDGVGNSPAERRFYNELGNIYSPRDFINRVKRNGCVAGEHRAYMVAKALADYNVIFVTEGSDKDYMSGLPFKHYNDISEALNYSDSITGENSRVYVIPRALATIAKLS